MVLEQQNLFHDFLQHFQHIVELMVLIWEQGVNLRYKHDVMDDYVMLRLTQRDELSLSHLFTLQKV